MRELKRADFSLCVLLNCELICDPAAYFFCFDWHEPLAQLSPTGTFNSNAPEWYVNFKKIPKIATRSKLSVILVAIVEFVFLELNFIFEFSLGSLPPLTTSFFVRLCPIKVSQTRQTGSLRFFSCSFFWQLSCFCATTYHRMISTCAAAGRQGMKFLCFFKSRKSGFMCTRWNAHLFFGVRNERLLCAPIRLCCLFFLSATRRSAARLKFCYFRVRAHIWG